MLLEASFHIAIHPLILFYDEYSNYYKSNLCIIIVHFMCFSEKFIFSFLLLLGEICPGVLFLTPEYCLKREIGIGDAN